MLVALVVVLVVVLVAGSGWVVRGRAIERERRRVVALTSLAERLRDLNRALEGPSAAPEPPPRAPGPLQPPGSGGRAAFLDALTDAVAHAGAENARLAVAVVESPSMPAPALADEVRAIAGADTYEVGSRTVALALPGVGRADALGLLARIQAACGATGNAVELEQGEDAVELLARLMGSAPSASARSGSDPEGV